MDELARCAELLHMAYDQNQRLQSFALRESEARELARQIFPIFSMFPPQPETVEELYEQMIINKVTLWGIPIRVVE